MAGWVERNRGKGEGEGEGEGGGGGGGGGEGGGGGGGRGGGGKGKGEGEGADGHVTENRRVTGSQVRRGEARERGLGAVNCTHVIVMWLIHNFVNEY